MVRTLGFKGTFMSKLKILYEDAYYVAVDKPAGFYVHPPEDVTCRIPKSQNTMALLRDQLQLYVYPVHRLDRATSGVLLFAKSSEAASLISKAFMEKRVEKKYFAFVRGFLKDKKTFFINEPLDGKDALTEVSLVAEKKFSEALGKFDEIRTSLLHVKLHTGRTHQIRRHLKRFSHPLYGDTVHGDGKHNQWIKTKVKKSGLFLKSYQIKFIHPYLNQQTVITTSWGSMWHQLFDEIGVCAWEAKTN